MAAKAAIASAVAATRVRIPIPIHLDAYDFDRGGFPLPSFNSFSVPTRNSCPYLPGSNAAGDIPYSYSLQFSDGSTLPAILAVSKEQGRALVGALPPDRSVHAEIVVDLLGVGSPGNDSTTVIRVRPVAIFVWTDAHEQRFVGVAGAAVPGAESAEATPPPSIPPPLTAPATGSPPNQATSSSITGPSQLVTGLLLVGGHPVALFGVNGLVSPATGLGKAVDGWIRRKSPLTCDLQPGGSFRCLTGSAAGEDVAQFILINGAGRASSNATPIYKAAEAQAKQARRGIWR